MNEAESLPESVPTNQRRALLGKGALAAGALLGVAAATSRTARAQTALTPANIFNFALNFEFLGAEYYLHAVTGTGLSSTYGGVSGNVYATNATVVPFQTAAVAGFAVRLASDEQAHVNLIRATLGSDAVAEPVIDIGVGPNNSWSKLAYAAGLIPAGATFNPYESEVTFLLGAYILEDVCVTALAGAAGLLVGQGAAYVQAAASLLGTEAAQAGAIRGYLSQIGAGPITNAISALRAKLSGVGDNGTDYNSNPYNFVNADYNGFVYDRTPEQILNVAYGKAGTGVTSGGFFPQGVSGSIVST